MNAIKKSIRAFTVMMTITLSATGAQAACYFDQDNRGATVLVCISAEKIEVCTVKTGHCESIPNGGSRLEE